MNLPEMPETAKPHEIAIMTIYYTIGMTNPNKISEYMHYKSNRQVREVLNKYRASVMANSVL